MGIAWCCQDGENMDCCVAPGLCQGSCMCTCPSRMRLIVSSLLPVMVRSSITSLRGQSLHTFRTSRARSSSLTSERAARLIFAFHRQLDVDRLLQWLSVEKACVVLVFGVIVEQGGFFFFFWLACEIRAHRGERKPPFGRTKTRRAASAFCLITRSSTH